MLCAGEGSRFSFRFTPRHAIRAKAEPATLSDYYNPDLKVVLPAFVSRRRMQLAVTDESKTIPAMTRFRIAMMLAILADALQVIFLPLLVEGIESPADDALDLGVGVALVCLLGWHWEFLPSALGKLVPGVDLVPFWTLAVANVYRRSKRIAVAAEEIHEEPRA
jgi:hypothetical protein